MDLFEGYVGIRLWDNQLINDVILSLLLVLLIAFALVFRSNYRLFVKMLKDVVYIKERPSLFEDVAGNEFVFRHFMTFQALFLCTFSVFAIGRAKGILNSPVVETNLLIIVSIFIILVIFYEFRQLMYALLGFVFVEKEKYDFWKTGYNAITGLWGVLLYIPVFWLVFVGEFINIPLMLFILLYILYRFLIIIKSIRIFHISANGFLYIFLYLCTQEILPLIFLYEGVNYLYNIIEKSPLWH